MLELRLSGTTVQMLIDNAHVSTRRDGPADASDISSADGNPDFMLDRVATRWYRSATRVRMGRGWQYRGQTTANEAAVLLDYIDSVAGALEWSEDAEGREEARTYRAQVEKAIGHLRRQGADVDIEVS